jgi:TolB-like protein/DNA-binding winged helix-turn-helix (wHTH) protein/Tfp pilus assembly protein PilF
MAGTDEFHTDQPFMLGDWIVDPARGRLSRGPDEHRIEPKAMTVLVCLAQQPGQVMSRELLEEKAWAGVVVGYDSLASAIIKLRKALGDDARNPAYIETVPKKGYRLICPVSTVSPGAQESDGQQASRSSTTRESTTSTRKSIPAGYLILAVLLVAALIAGWFAVTGENQEPAQGSVAISEKPVIAVLPFRNLSADTQQDYFSDGITADLITDLSKLSGLSVIARNSVFVYRNVDVDIRSIKQELGVDYVVEGSIRKAGEQVRISARLIDADSSINLWADRFDGTLDNIFAFQDTVTSKIIAALKINLTDRERTRLARKYSSSIEAYDLFLRGWQSLWLSSREGSLQARDYFHKAIELDSQFARAYANLALTYIYDHMLGWSEDSEESLRKAHSYADQAIAIDPDLPQVYWVKGFADIFHKDYEQSLENAQRALDLDPNFADGYGLLATTLNYAGKPDEADVEMRKAMQLNPMNPAIYKVIHGEIFFNKREYAKAIGNFNFALQTNPESEESRLWLAAAYAHVGETEEAAWQLEQIRISGRELSLEHIENVTPFKDPAQRKHFIDGLRKAGLKD